MNILPSSLMRALEDSMSLPRLNVWTAKQFNAVTAIDSANAKKTETQLNSSQQTSLDKPVS